jgi:uncharacterized protein
MLRLAVVAHPGARVQRVAFGEDDELHVWVRARPVEGQANAAIEEAIANALDLRPRQVRLTAGATRRRKILEIDVSDLEVLRARLLAHRLRGD